jgi:glycosyltransferase involved in cell wall biosynthesis
MKVLYAAYRHNPTNPDLSSGADYQFYTAIKHRAASVRIHQRELGSLWWGERLLRRVHEFYYQNKSRYAKFPLTRAWRESNTLSRAEKDWQPDVVFTMFPPGLVFYRGTAPAVYRLDTTFWGWQKQYPEFSNLALQLSMWEEKRAFASCARIITHSEWTRNILINRYDVDPDIIRVFSNPAALPSSVVPSELDVQTLQKLRTPVRLLFVGKDYHRKGEDFAVKIVNRLNAEGVESKLVVCGGPRKESTSPHIHYVGYFRKTIPDELQQYVSLYHQAHLLLHPARFDPSPIVTSEAAAFGVPTITNAVGGIPTSVKHDESGIVLPKGSEPDRYVQAIKELIQNPDRYSSLCMSTYHRYKRELNWDVAGKKLMMVLKEAACASKGGLERKD